VFIILSEIISVFSTLANLGCFKCALQIKLYCIVYFLIRGDVGTFQCSHRLSLVFLNPVCLNMLLLDSQLALMNTY